MTARRRGAVPTGTAQESLRELVRVAGLMRRLSGHHFSRVGLSPAQWGVLRSLMRLEEAGQGEPRMHELGSALLVRPPSLGATLERMVRAGWVCRRSDPEDRRSRLISLSPAGRELVRHGLRDHAAWVSEVMDGLGDAERAQLLTLLRKLGRHLRVLDEDLRASREPGRTPPGGRLQRKKT